MPSKKLQDYKDLLIDKKVICTIAIARKNDAPHITPVWFGVTQENFDNQELTFNTLRGRVKDKLITVGTKISINIFDPDQLSRYISIDGVVKQIINGKEGTNHINELAHKYTGNDAAFLNPGDERIKYVVKMEKFY